VGLWEELVRVMTIATIKVSVPGLIRGRKYDVEKVVFDEVFMGRQTGAVHLKRYLDKEHKTFNTIVVPLDYVELTVVGDGNSTS